MTTQNALDPIEIARYATDVIGSYVSRFTVTGAVRRGSVIPGLIEIVVIPRGGKRFDEFKRLWESKYNCEFDGYVWKINLFGNEIKYYVSNPDNFAVRVFLTTGPKKYTRMVAKRLKERGYKIDINGIWSSDGKRVEIVDEAQIFELAGMKFVMPKKRRKGY